MNSISSDSFVCSISLICSAMLFMCLPLLSVCSNNELKKNFRQGIAFTITLTYL
nr:MAG TPA: hypothetical protein [Caudoviricetes sp.]